MAIAIIRQLKAKQISGFFRFFIKNPFFALATFIATIKTYKVAEKNFPKIHGRHTKANAFRHALWNAFIASSCSMFSKRQNTIIQWTKDVTDWHEDLFVNEPLSRAMDLHNNEIGRSTFEQHLIRSNKELTKLLLDFVPTAVLISSIEEISKNPNKLVYLEDL